MEKQAQRALALVRREALSPAERETFSAAICRHLMTLSVLQEAKAILSYRATEQEADLSAFHAWAAEQGKALAFPVSGPNGHMEAYIPRGPESWERGRYGIWAPIPERSERILPETLDAVILPCVGFDGQGRRLGHGGGYYDHYLPQCPKVARILVAFEAQRLERVAEDEHDQRFHAAVTETGALSVSEALDSLGPGTIYY